MDHKGFEFQTITLVILEAFAFHNFDKIHVTKCIKVINFNCVLSQNTSMGIIFM
jgi:hypothetical protein